MLAALGLGSAAITEPGAQARTALSASDMNGALAIQGREMPGGDIELIRQALQRNLDQFQRIRDFEMSDDVGLPIVFRPRGA